MMRYFCLFFFIFAAVPFGLCQSCNNNGTDTVSCINISDGRGINFKILQTIDLLDNHWADSTRKLIILYDTKKAVIHLPVPDENVKNFTIDCVEKKYNGFTLVTFQGGAPSMVRRLFDFRVNKNQLYLYKIVSKYSSFDSRRTNKVVYRLHPKMKIDEIDISSFL